MFKYLTHLKQKKKKGVFNLDRTKISSEIRITLITIYLPGSKGRGDNKFEKAYNFDKQIDYIVGERNDPKHKCHMHNEHVDNGKNDVIHRGGCAVCDDKGGKNTYTKLANI